MSARQCRTKPDTGAAVAEPTDKVRRGTRDRDGERCPSCGTAYGLTYQHRQAVGMGGSKKRPGYADGIAACGTCNTAFEGELQARALALGWKVRRWVKDAALVPYWHEVTQQWYRITHEGPWRTPISIREAARMMLDVYGPDGPNGPGGATTNG